MINAHEVISLLVMLQCEAPAACSVVYPPCIAGVREEAGECEVPAAPGNVTVALSAAVAADLEQSSTDLKEMYACIDQPTCSQLHLTFLTVTLPVCRVSSLTALLQSTFALSQHCPSPRSQAAPGNLTATCEDLCRGNIAVNQMTYLLHSAAVIGTHEGAKSASFRPCYSSLSGPQFQLTAC